MKSHHPGLPECHLPRRAAGRIRKIQRFALAAETGGEHADLVNFQIRRGPDDQPLAGILFALKQWAENLNLVEQERILEPPQDVLGDLEERLPLGLDLGSQYARIECPSSVARSNVGAKTTSSPLWFITS